jgi:hypothetical protein
VSRLTVDDYLDFYNQGSRDAKKLRDQGFTKIAAEQQKVADKALKDAKKAAKKK